MTNKEQLGKDIRRFLSNWSFIVELDNPDKSDLDYRRFLHGLSHLVIEVGKLTEVTHIIDHAGLKNIFDGNYNFDKDIINHSLGKLLAAVMICTKYSPVGEDDMNDMVHSAIIYLEENG